MKTDPKKIGLFSAVILVFTTMVGAGIFTTTGQFAATLGNPLDILLAWVIAALFAITGVLTLGELGAMLPSSGGEYIYFQRAYGKHVGFVGGLLVDGLGWQYVFYLSTPLVLMGIVSASAVPEHVHVGKHLTPAPAPPVRPPVSSADAELRTIEQVRIAGDGQFHPLVANTDGGTAENRRVEIFLVPAPRTEIVAEVDASSTDAFDEPMK